MPRLPTLLLAAIVIVFTDMTWDGTSLHISVGWPRQKPFASFAFPRPAPDLEDAKPADQA